MYLHHYVCLSPIFPQLNPDRVDDSLHKHNKKAEKVGVTYLVFIYY